MKISCEAGLGSSAKWLRSLATEELPVFDRIADLNGSENLFRKVWMNASKFLSVREVTCLQTLCLKGALRETLVEQKMINPS